MADMPKTGERQLALGAICPLLVGSSDPQLFEDATVMLVGLHDEHDGRCRAYSEWVRDRAEEALMLTGDVKAAERIIRCVKRLLQLNADSDFDSYMLYMEWDREPDKQFYRPRRHVLRPLVADLQDLFESRLDFLSISMPSRTGKSTMCIFFLTFVMGALPHKANVMSGHSDKLTEGFYREALSIITDQVYKFHEVFPKARLADTSAKNESISLGQRRRFPTLTCRSIDGTLTGAVEVGKGALLYCDDLVSDREEALSTERMDKLYNAYLNQLKDRMNDGAKQLFVATRWVPNDPIGRIQEEYGDNPRYRFTVLPALDDDGESNFEYLYGLGFSKEYYEDMRSSLEAAGEGDSWDAKYMGAPRYIGGLMFPREELRTYADLPDGEPDAVIAVCDTKLKGKDYEVLPIAKVYGADYYIDDVVCDNRMPEYVEPKVASALVRNNAGIVRFESNGAGGRISAEVRRMVEEQGHSMTFKEKYSTQNKETRILADAQWVKDHCLFRADEPTSDYKKFMSQLTHYTTEGKNKHDDAPDAMSMLKRLATSMGATTVRAAKRIV